MKFDLKKPEDRQPKKWDKAKKEEKNEIPREQRGAGLDREVTIRLNPKKIFKGFFVITLLLGVFFLGRLSVPGTFSDSSTLSAAATAEENPLDAEEIVLEESAEEEVVEEVVEEKPVDEEVEEEPKEEVVVTTYDNVVLTLTDVGVDWKDTWGKITSVTYTIKNDEEGAIKPHHFTMMVEGYPADEPGEFEVSFSSQKVGSHTSIKDSSVVYGYGGKTKGFSYNPSETGDLASVEIKLFLWDKDNNLIAHSKMMADLNG